MPSAATRQPPRRSPWLVHQRFAAVAARHPDRVAVSAGDERLRYRDLDARANRLAHLLRRAGVGRDATVGVLVDKHSPDFVITVLAVWRAGAAYVPVDPATPAPQVHQILDGVRAAALVGSGDLARRYADRVPATVRLDTAAAELARMPPDDPAVPAHPDQLAYIVHTSGSTGEPKPVAVTHRALVTVYLGWEDRYGLATAPPTCLQAARPAFDVHVGDLARALLAGGRLVLCHPHAVLDPPLLADLIARESVDVAELTPTVWRLLAGWLTGQGRRLPSLRLAISGGEQLTASTYRQLRGALGPQPRIVNSYGVAEATIDSTYADVTDDLVGDADVVPIGWPFPGVAVAVLDEDGRPVPEGAVGELYLAGAGLAAGYHLRPALTAERFLPAAPGLPGRLMYRTGDLVTRRPDGALVHIGRSDDEVKVRGVRVLLSAAETAVLALPAVTDAAVVRAERAGETVLVAHVVLADGSDRSPETLRETLARRLPEAMVPAEFVVHDQLPRNPAGKADRRALARTATPDPAAPGQVFVTRTPAERIVVDAWTAALGRPPRDRSANLFAEGGTSLTAARLAATIRDSGADLSVSTVFLAPTVAELSRAVAARAATVEPMAPLPRDVTDVPLASGHHGLWLLHQLGADAPAYHLPTLVHLTGPLDPAALQQALDLLITRHDALRTAFVAGVEGPRMRVAAPMPFPLEIHQAPPATLDGAAAVVTELVHRPFDLGRAPLIRGVLIRRDESRWDLALVTHHIVFDDWSERILLRELGIAYSALVRGEAPSLPALALRHLDVVASRTERLSGDAGRAQQEYWRQRLAHLPAPVDLPPAGADPPDGPPATGSRTLPAALSDRVRSVASAHAVTPYVVLLAVFAVLLRRWSGQEDLVVGVPFGYRDRPETRPVVGFLVSTLPLRLNVPDGATFADLLPAVRDALAEASAHADVPFERMVTDAGRSGGGDRNPVFRTWFNWLGAPTEPPALTGVAAHVAHLTVPAPLFDLAVYVTDGPDGYRVDLVVDGRVLDVRYLEPLLDQYCLLVDQLSASPRQPVDRPPLRPTEGPDAPPPGAALPPGTPPLLRQLASVAAGYGDRTAVRGAGGQATYRQLYRQAGDVAAALRTAGIGAGDVVPLYAERLTQLVPALLGVLGAGAAFTILDAAYPPGRLVTHLAAAQPRVGLRLVAPLPEPVRDGCPTWWTLPASDGPESGNWPVTSPPASGYAYLAVTSGTGGGPKVVRGGREPLRHFLTWYTDRYQFTSQDRFALLSGLGHDPLLRDVLTPLWVGGTLCVPPGNLLRQPVELRAWLRSEAVTVLHVTPALCRMLSIPAAAEVLTDVRLVLCAGDALYADDVAGIRSWAPAATVVNGYGTTETPQVVAFHEVEARRPLAGRVPIGAGAPGAELAVVDGSGRRTGVGERGTVVVRSSFLADAAGVVPDPTDAGLRRFVTGDLGRYDPDGNVTMLGRADDQVQIRGFRVELAEVDRCLLSHPDVVDAASRTLPGPDGELQLVGYVVPRADTLVVGDRVRAHVRAALPDHMVPARVVPVAHIPLTPNRKPDRAALPTPTPTPRAPVTGGPGTPLERLVADVWRRALQLDQVPSDQNFFDLGATSVLLVRVHADLEAALSRDLPVAVLFEHTTVRSLAAHLAGHDTRPAADRQRVPLADLRARRSAARIAGR